ncbi:hypothetical protein DL96DRAFT_675777 [Flagelloscypha sp. PMI_526]|nr:hypothetical protein DL96DRAFT_675777 [Flagelloscypha sp. PMI_526]
MFPRREWVPPEPTAPTFRAKVEQKERATGMRCWDMSCGIGPSDDDPASTSAQAVSSTPQIRIRKNSSSALPSSGKGKEREEDHGPVEYACEHSFHPSCLVSATRVALSVRGVSVEPERDEQSGDVHLHCPVCRVDGCR